MQIELKGNCLILKFRATPAELRRVRSLPARRFDPSTGFWLVPHTTESWAALRAQGFDLAGIPEPTTSGYAITAHRRGGLLVVRTPWSAENTDKLRRMPDYRMWKPEEGAWLAKPTRRNIDYLVRAFPYATWDARAAEWRDEQEAHVSRTHEAARAKAMPLAELMAKGDDYKHGGPAPFDWQRRCFLISRDMPAFAVFAEQRTGKTKYAIDNACWLFTRGRVKQALVIAPNSVKTNWVTDELPLHMPDYVEWAAASWKSTPKRADRDALADVLEGADDKMRWFSMNVEALSSERGAEAAMAYVKRADTIVFVDESTRIKTPRSRRTLAAIALSKHAPYRRILTGTPATQGPLDLYAQFEFLDPKILGFGSWYSFRNHFSIMGGFNGKVVLGYQRLDELEALINPYSFRVTRDECFDIPPKGYQKLVVDMTTEQARVYGAMRDRMRADLAAGGRVTATLVITQMLRLAQIAGGFATTLDDDTLENRVHAIPGGNPKVEALIELAEQTQGKMLVWARFRPEIAAAAAALRAEHGADSVVEFHGDVDDDGRVAARTSFQDPASPVRFLVGQTETGGLGLNLDQARTIAYLSNGFSLESRLQSEDRPMSSRQKHSVAVVDIIARGTIDEKVVVSLRGKQDVARTITGDKWKEWI